MARKKLPTWFSPWTAPYTPSAPAKPTPTITKKVLVKTITGGYDKTPKSEVMELDYDYLELDYELDNDVVDVYLRFYKETSVDNPKYEHELKAYEKRIESYKVELAAHEARYKEWLELKKQYDLEAAAKVRASELKQLETLKKKYEGSGK